MRGTVDSTSLGQGREVRNAVFNLLERDDSGRLWMKYRLEFTSDGGVPYVMEGFKDVHNDRMLDFWYDTTALFTEVRPADMGAADEPSFQGILRIRPIDLVPQVISMRGLNTANPLRHALALGRFGWFFFFTLVKEYARPPRRAPREAPA
jgi:cholesterol oxidase